MPVKFRTNNRVLNSNARAVDVARSMLKAVVPVQNRRHHAAFQVHGFKAILYTPLKSGIQCACKNRSKAAVSLLGGDGKASQGLINQLLTGESFGTLPYAVTPTQADETDNVSIGSLFSKRSGSSRPPTSVNDGFATTEMDPRAGTILPKARGGQDDQNTVGLPDEFEGLVDVGDPDPDDEFWGLDQVAADENQSDHVRTVVSGSALDRAGFFDATCPVCFGWGFVGGYSVHNGYRAVVSPASDQKSQSVVMSAGANIDYQTQPPAVRDCTSVQFTLTLPKNVQSVDALRVMNNMKAIGATFTVDDVALSSEYDLVAFCDGRSHVFKATFAEATVFTHIEVQLNQSTNEALFEFPKLNRSGDPLKIDDTDPFSINLSPLIPYVAPRSVIAESTYGKVLLVKNVPSWNTKDRTVLGWECEVRVVQPAELLNLLPRRANIQKAKRPLFVRDNRHGHRRT